jgi:hypothetical protein
MGVVTVVTVEKNVKTCENRDTDDHQWMLPNVTTRNGVPKYTSVWFVPSTFDKKCVFFADHVLRLSH